MRTVPNKVGKRIADGLAKSVRTAAGKVEGTLLDHLHDRVGGIGSELIIDGERDAATGHLDSLDFLALGRHGGYDGHHAVVGELLTVAQNDGVGITDAKAVNVDHATLDGSTALDLTGAHLKGITVVDDKDIVTWNAHLFTQLCVGAQMDRLAVNGHEVGGASHGEHELELLLAAVTGHMNQAAMFVIHVATKLSEAVDNLLNGLLVAGNGGGGDNDGIAIVNRKRLMLTVGHTGKRGEGLAL